MKTGDKSIDMDIFKGAYRMIDGICLRLQGLLVYRILACPYELDPC